MAETRISSELSNYLFKNNDLVCQKYPHNTIIRWIESANANLFVLGNR